MNLNAYNSSNSLIATGSAGTVGLFIVNPNITNWQSTDVSGTSITNGINYQVYVFKSTGITYTVNYSVGGSYMYVLAVGGGGSGCNYMAAAVVPVVW